ncbi:MAG: hypothetical protein GEU26_12870 [Nitrososphaeraceae archaeon]|nr:hypothetical protein [Nitrososphaeraceae archaeon]
MDLIANQIIKKNPDLATDKYNIFILNNATGVCYITNSSPQYISGHLRLRGKNNGEYPYGFKEGLLELFGRCTTSHGAIEVCSGEIMEDLNLITVDINPSKNPTHVLDAQILPDKWSNRFDRWHCDPPYSEKAAKEMYQTVMPSIPKLLTEGARITKAGGLLFLLLGAKNMQWYPSSLIRI